MKWRLVIGFFLACTVFVQAHAQAQRYNFPGKTALILNTSPNIELSDFTFANTDSDRRMRFEQNLAWTNIGQQTVVAFEIVILKYDAFDQREIGSSWTVTGTNSGNWKPLKPGEASRDGLLGFGTEEVFTAIAYVRAVRLEGGTVWRVNDADLQQNLRKVAPGIKDFGSVKPDPKVKEAK